MTDLAVLKTELTTDPAAVGYAALIAAEDWRGARDAVNQPRGATAQASSVSPGSLRTQMVASEYFALTAEQRELVRFYLGGEEPIDVSPGTPIRAALGAAFPGSSTTRANWLAVLSNTNASRAESLFGVGVTVRWDECRDAMRIP